MGIPLVSEEIISSIAIQQQRSNKASDSIEDMYFMQSMKEIQSENPHLASAIFSTAKTFAETYDLDPTDTKDMTMVANVIHLAAAVYQSIKQQMICDELE